MKKSIFFDLDGTLTDPKIGITRSIRYAMEKLDVAVPDKELTWCIGPPLLDSFEVLVGEKLALKAIAYYRERFTDIGWQENQPYPGVSETLKILFESGIPLYVATSKPHVYAQKIIDHFEMDQYFNGLFGSELDGTRSKKDDLLQYALSKTGSSEASTMIGDRKHDILGALSNNMRTIGVTYGYGSSEELEKAGAHELVDQPKGLLPFLV